NELQNFSLHLVYRNDFLNELQRKLKAMVKDASDKNKQKIKGLHLQISQNLQNGQDAKIIEEKINEINSGFLFNLSEKFPHLTENDKNLCAMVRMNLSSKEIASIKNISERSVITARYRLRQKLDLSSDQNLNDFLKQV
ncbi:MAG: helix-turn-helix transcriptional regulator, partial [Bacteroidota bacterium]